MSYTIRPLNSVDIHVLIMKQDKTFQIFIHKLTYATVHDQLDDIMASAITRTAHTTFLQASVSPSFVQNILIGS